MKIEVYKTMIVGSYHVFIGDVQYWCTPSNNYVCCKRPLAESSKRYKEIMSAVNDFIQTTKD